MKWGLILSLVSGVQGIKLFAKSRYPESTCGSNGVEYFDSLNDGSKDYFNTIKEKLWVHPANRDGFNVFQEAVKCWYGYMLSTKCGGLKPQPDRKADLVKLCEDPKSDYLQVWKKFSKPEFSWYKQSFPDNEDDERYSAEVATAKNLNKKEFLCTTLFVIDDECVAHKRVKFQ